MGVVWGSRFGVWALFGVRIRGLKFVWDAGFGIWGLCGVEGSGFQVCLRFGVWDLVFFEVQSLGFGV